jgi:hypothetical protein
MPPNPDPPPIRKRGSDSRYQTVSEVGFPQVNALPLVALPRDTSTDFPSSQPGTEALQPSLVVTTKEAAPADVRRVGEGFYRLLVRADQVVPVLELRDVALLPILLPGSDRRRPARRTAMKGYIARKGNRWYAVIYEGTELREVYFEAVGVILTMILLGRFFEARAKAGTREAIRKLIGLQARTARVVREAHFQGDSPPLQYPHGGRHRRPSGSSGHEAHYNRHRPHRGIGLDPPEALDVGATTVPVKEIRRTRSVGGLITEYRGVAA